jgi:hypothetical protein
VKSECRPQIKQYIEELTVVEDVLAGDVTKPMVVRLALGCGDGMVYLLTKGIISNIAGKLS